jgi:hypothetical protein
VVVLEVVEEIMGLEVQEHQVKEIMAELDIPTADHTDLVLVEVEQVLLDNPYLVHLMPAVMEVQVLLHQSPVHL